MKEPQAYKRVEVILLTVLKPINYNHPVKSKTGVCIFLFYPRRDLWHSLQLNADVPHSDQQVGQLSEEGEGGCGSQWALMLFVRISITRGVSKNEPSMFVTISFLPFPLFLSFCLCPSSLSPSAKKFRKVVGKETCSETLESTPSLEKEKFPQDYFPEVGSVINTWCCHLPVETSNDRNHSGTVIN